VSQLKFDRGAYTVAWRGHSIVLLPKEFALLEYLHDHPGRTFTREGLLNAVWPLESPVDRTVDDHIYRLRKKLAHWEYGFRIETVRGMGYRLLAIEPAGGDKNPLRNVGSFSDHMKEIVNAYLRYGRGDALLTLIEHKDTLGIEWDPSFQLFLRFLEGDVRFLLEQEKSAFSDRAIMLLLLNQFIHPQENRRYIEAAIRRKALSPMWQFELETMLLVQLYMDWGEYGKAKEKLDDLKAEVDRNGWEGLIPYVANLTVEYDMRTERWDELGTSLSIAEERLRQYPYQREEGRFLILKGIAMYRGHLQDGLHAVDQGIHILKHSQFLPHWMSGIQTILYFSRRFGWTAVHERYVEEWNRMSRQTGLDEVKVDIAKQLQNHLGSL